MFSPTSSVPFSRPHCSSQHLAPLTPFKGFHSRLCPKQLYQQFGATENSTAQSTASILNGNATQPSSLLFTQTLALTFPCYCTLILESSLKDICFFIAHGKGTFSSAISLNWGQGWESCTICCLTLLSCPKTIPDLSFIQRRELKTCTRSSYT